jgi:cell division protein FtsA
VLAVGGDHISNDLAYGLKVPLSRAEKLKIEHGSALLDHSKKGLEITIVNELGLPLKTVNLEHLQRIMSLRVQEIFEVIAQELERVGLTDYLRAGVFLSGGSSRVAGIEKLAEKIFQMNATHGHAATIGGLTAALDQPEFATAIGLVKYGSLKNRRPANGGVMPAIKNIFGRLMQRS